MPIIKPGKEECNGASKYRPISLINIGGKLLERLMIDRILFHTYITTTCSSTTCMDSHPREEQLMQQWKLKKFIEESLRLKQCTVIVSLDVKGAFDAAWWPSILKQLRELKCPKNLYNLPASYFSNRKATLSINNYKTEKAVQKGCPQGSFCGPGFWNVIYNSILNLKFNSRTKVIAFADDLS